MLAGITRRALIAPAFMQHSLGYSEKTAPVFDETSMVVLKIVPESGLYGRPQDRMDIVRRLKRKNIVGGFKNDGDHPALEFDGSFLWIAINEHEAAKAISYLRQVYLKTLSVKFHPLSP